MEVAGPRRPRQRFALQVVLPISVLLATALALLFATTAWTALEQNRYALETSRRLAAGVLRAARDDMRRGIVDYAVWDDAARHLVLEFDEAWATENAEWFRQTFGADLAFVIDGAGGTVHGAVDGARSALAAEAALGGGVDALVRAARASPGTAAAGMLLDAAGAPALAVAAAIAPHGGELRLPLDAPSVWLAADRLDAARLAEIGEVHMLPGLRFAPAPAPIPTGAADLTLEAADGTRLGGLVWSPDRPGSELLRRLLPPLAALTAVLAAAAGLVLRHARRAALLVRASEERALTDPLTGLPNRTLLRQRVEEGLRRLGRGGPGLAVLYLDLDGFKQVNDGHGHEAGDELLRLVAARLRGCLREGDTLARLGGDEFVILLPELRGLAAAVACAERARAALEGPFRVGEAEFRIGVSIGVAAAPPATAGADALLRAADRALYLAKRAGRGTWRLADGLDPAAQRDPTGPGPLAQAVPAQG